MDNEQLLQAIQESRNWIDYLSALLMPTIAVLGSIIALQQWRTNRKRLRHELFDRRYEQFAVIRNFLGSIMSSGKASQEEQHKYLTGTRGVRFVFDKDVSERIHKEIWCPAMDLECLESELDGVPVGNERSENVRKQSEIKKKLYQELASLEDSFAKYLQLEQ